VRVIRQILARGLPVDILLRKTLRFRIGVPVTLQWSALQIACAKGHAEVVAELVAARADSNLRTGHGSTPLHLALMAPTKQSRRTICAVLLCCGADAMLADWEQAESAVDAARRRFGGRAKIAGFLHSPPPLSELYWEVQKALPGFDVVGAAEAATALPTGGHERLQRSGIGLRRMAAVPRLFDSAPLNARAMAALEEKASIKCVETLEEAERSALCGICLHKMCATGRRTSRNLPEGPETFLESDSESSDDEELDHKEASDCGLWRLPCAGRHMFHAACVKPWFRRSGLCPTCRCQCLIGAKQ